MRSSPSIELTMCSHTDPSQRVLVVETDAVRRELLAQVLRMAGFTPVATDAGERALRVLRAERGAFAALFAPVDLPGLVDGWIVADEFRATNPSRPIVLAAAEAAPAGDDAMAILREPVAPLDIVSVLKCLVASVARPATPETAEVTRAAA